MKLIVLTVAIMGTALSLPCSDYPKLWQKDGYGGSIWADNPDCKIVTAYDNVTPAADFPSAINAFTQKFHSKYVDSKPDEANLVFSPFSIHNALAMLASGATTGSETQMELLNVLGGLGDIKKLETAYKELLDEYRDFNKASRALEFGNKVWMAEEGSVEDSFRALSGSVYYSEIGPLEDAEAVNEWVSKRTNGKIKKLLDQLSADTKFLLTNVVYFHDTWTASFLELEPEYETIPEFKLLNGRKGKSEPKWMSRSSKKFILRNITLGGMQLNAVSVPYSQDKGGRFDMVLVVPVGDNLGDIRKLEDVGGNLFDEINTAFEKEYANEFEKKWGRPDLTLTMPMFSLKGDADVAEILQKLGVRGIFQKGEFSNINGGVEPLKVGNILHKATVDVDTEGTEAAAAAGVEIVPLTIHLLTANLLIDRPFMFVIRDRKKRVPLFVGRVMDPAKKE